MKLSFHITKTILFCAFYINFIIHYVYYMYNVYIIKNFENYYGKYFSVENIRIEELLSIV